RILNEAKQPQFLPGDSVLPNEELRLKYRYIDLRRDAMQFNIELRHKVAIAIRDYLSSHGFFEIETLFMTHSTPESARHDLVPGRESRDVGIKSKPACDGNSHSESWRALPQRAGRHQTALCLERRRQAVRRF